MTEETLFHLALKKTPPERAGFLAAACPDPEVRRRVEALLRAHDNPGSFLAGPAVETPTDTYADPAAPTEDHPPAAGEPGAAVGPYRLLQRVGEGGMGEVWMAEQTEPVRRQVALKLIKPGMDSKAVLARFEAERQALALMDHPNVARVFDAGTSDSGRPYFVMELIKGRPITKYCDEQHLGLRERLELFVQVCRAVHHAHQKGVIHRDLKPSNVLVCEVDGNPVPKVIDFGVAKAAGPKLTERTLFTGFGQVVGTLEYMSPEQAELNQLDIDTRTDVYSLGVLLYELLTGTTPLDRKRLADAALLEALRLIREEEPPKPSTRLSKARSAERGARNAGPPSVPRSALHAPSFQELDWIVMKCLEKDRNRRYDTATGLAMDVDRYLCDEPVLAGPPSATYRLRKFARRNRGVLAVAGVILLALLVAVGSLAGVAVTQRWSNDQIGAALGEKSRALDDKTRALEDLRVEKKKADDALSAEQNAAYQRSVAMAHLAFLSNDLDLANEMLDERPVAQRHWEWHYLKRLAHRGEVAHHLGGSSRWSQITTSADGRLVAHVRGDMLWVQDIRDQGRRSRFPLGENAPLARVCISDDGKQVAVAANGGTRVWDLVAGVQTHTLSGGPRTSAAVAFQPGGRLLAWLGPGGINLLDLTTGQVAHRLVHPPTPLSDVYFTPDGRRLVTVLPPGTVRVWDVARGVQLFEYRDGFANVGIAISPDGRHYATCTANGVKVCDLETGEVVQNLSGRGLARTGADHVSLAYSRDGRRLVTGSIDKTARVWNLQTGQEVQRFLSPHEIHHAQFIGPEQYLLTVDASGAVCLRDTKSAPEGLSLRLVIDNPARFKGQSEALSDAVLAHDGRAIAVATQTGIIRVVSADTGATIFELPNHGRLPRVGMAFSPDGRLLATTSFDHRVIHLWDARDGRPLDRIPCREGSPDRVQFSPDGRLLAARLIAQGQGTHHLIVWETDTWRERFSRARGQGVYIPRFSFSPDGRWLAVTNMGDRPAIWDTATGRDVLALGEPGRTFESVAFSARGGLIAAGDAEGAVHLWDPGSGEARGVLRSRPARIAGLAFSPDGRRLVCSALHPTQLVEVRVWDVESGRLLLRLDQGESVNSVQFSSDGHRLLAASTGRLGSELRVYDGTPWVPAPAKSKFVSR